MDSMPTRALDGQTLEEVEGKELSPEEISAAIADLDDQRLDGRTIGVWERNGGRPPRRDGGRDATGNVIVEDTMKHVHEAMVHYMVRYPHATLREVAEHFNYTPSWVSRICASDMFKKRLAEVRKDHFANLATTVVEKVEGLAHAALDKMARHLDASEDPKYVKEVAKDALTMLGYGAKSSPAAVSVNGDGAQVMVVADASTLARARAIMQNQGASNVIPLPAPSDPSDAS